MRRVRVLALALLVLAGVASWFYVRQYPGHHAVPHSTSPNRATGPRSLQTIAGSAATAAPQGSAGAPGSAHTTQTFNQRLRCTQIRMLLKRM